MNARRRWTVLCFGLLGSQAGHLLAYQVRFGAAAQQLQGSGAHSYFPGLVRTSLGVAAALLLAGVFVIGLARILGGRSVRPDSAPHYLRLLAVLYTAQLTFFAGQEVGEALIAGTPIDSVANFLLWGTLGQLPVAVVAAAGLRWLMARLEYAINEIRIALATRPKQISWVGLPAVPHLGHHSLELVLIFVAGASLAKRAPPSSLRLGPTNSEA